MGVLMIVCFWIMYVDDGQLARDRSGWFGVRFNKWNISGRSSGSVCLDVREVVSKRTLLRWFGDKNGDVINGKKQAKEIS